MKKNIGNETEQRKDVRGVKIRTVNYLMMTGTCIVFIFLIWMTVKAYTYYDALKVSTENYVTGRKAANDMRRASDHLTEQVRLFVVRGDKMYADAYFEEAKETRRRDQAIEYFKRLGMDEEMEEEFQLSMNWSLKLMYIEYKAMYLTAQVNNIDLSTMPEEVQSVKLTEQEEALSLEEKRQLALDLVFNDIYEEYKAIIYNHLDSVIKSEMQIIYDDMTNNSISLKASLSKQRVMITILFLINTAMFAIIITLIIHPLNIYIDNIKNDSLIEVIGSYEFKYLALTYNDIYELNNETKSLLKYSAEHDPLSNVLNRTAFDSITKILKNRPIKIALLMVDIDKFKSVNDTYGHEVGDYIIKKVAKLLEGSMRANDKVTRYGGDEFAIIMMDIDYESKNIIRNKIEEINEILMNPTDGLPPTSVSVGIAFSKIGYQDELFTNADEALYEVKKHERHGAHISNIVIDKSEENESKTN